MCLNLCLALIVHQSDMVFSIARESQRDNSSSRSEDSLGDAWLLRRRSLVRFHTARHTLVEHVHPRDPNLPPAVKSCRVARLRLPSGIRSSTDASAGQFHPAFNLDAQTPSSSCSTLSGIALPRAESVQEKYGLASLPLRSQQIANANLRCFPTADAGLRSW